MKIENLLTAGVCWQKYIFTFILYVQILVHSTKITIRTKKIYIRASSTRKQKRRAAADRERESSLKLINLSSYNNNSNSVS
jgi:hypothetical protein